MENQEYSRALKLGEKAYRNAVTKGEYPYLPALDDILTCVNVYMEEKLGVVDIPLEQIVGTKTAGRQNAFAVNFMPLMEPGTEFSAKWSRLYEYQTETGNTDPIVAYEFMNKFYVQEGNKRVSVFKFLDAASIEGEVIRIIPKKSETFENRLYYEFLDFYKCNKINYIWFSKLGSFEALTVAVGKELGEVWSEDEVDEFTYTYTVFQKLFEEKGGKYMPITTGDAFLFYISLFSYETVKQQSKSEMKRDLERIWNELSLLNKAPAHALVMEPEENQDISLRQQVMRAISGTKKLKVAFLHDRLVEYSSWCYGHELGRAHLDEVFEEDIETKSYFQEGSGLDAMELLEKAIQDGNEIIFTASQKYLSASLKKALEYPDVKILNCSINRPYNALRTYYGRMYEAKFLCGMVAGAMTPNDKIACCEDFPIYGAFANINAFALGAQMINPRAKVYVHWLSDTSTDFDKLLEEHQISVVSYTDMIRLASINRKFGLYMVEGDRTVQLAMPVWNWGKFYEKIVRDIQDGNWNRSSEVKARKAVNYWWGISSEIIDLITSQNLPKGITDLVNLMRREIFEERFSPFSGEITLQDGTIIGTPKGVLSPEQIITMHWYVNNVIGDIPSPENLTEDARMMIALQESLTPVLGENI